MLLRDYLRTHRDRAMWYAEVKNAHSHLLDVDREAYVEAKAPAVWRLLQEADLWAQSVGWEAGPSDC